MKTRFNNYVFSLALLLVGFGTHYGYAQTYVDNVTVQRPGATLFIINESQSAWSRAGLVLNNPYQALSTKFEILYEKNGSGSTGTSSTIFRKSNSSGFLNYMQFNDSNNSIYFFANKSGSQSYGNLYLSNGNFLLGSSSRLGIGTNSPTEKLEVNGTIRAKEIKLEATNWPDYVFENDYRLMALEEVKAYIDQKGHLPGLKSAREYGEDGVNMLELNQKLLEKVEELTLHLVRQQQRSDKQLKLITDQQKRLDMLEVKLDLSNN